MPWRVLTSRPLAASHSFHRVIRRRHWPGVSPSGLKATQWTDRHAPSTSSISLPLAASHTLTAALVAVSRLARQLSVGAESHAIASH